VGFLSSWNGRGTFWGKRAIAVTGAWLRFSGRAGGSALATRDVTQPTFLSKEVRGGSASLRKNKEETMRKFISGVYWLLKLIFAKQSVSEESSKTTIIAVVFNVNLSAKRL
jgi:hypothetical protein